MSFRSQSGSSGGIIWNDFVGLGANRQLLVWISLRVYGGGSVTIGGTGNPSTVVVSSVSTGGQTTSIPYALTSTSDGRATLYLVPTSSGMGGAWLGSTLYGF